MAVPVAEAKGDDVMFDAVGRLLLRWYQYHDEAPADGRGVCISNRAAGIVAFVVLGVELPAILPLIMILQHLRQYRNLHAKWQI